MFNFKYFNPVQIIFGQNQINQLNDTMKQHVSYKTKVLVLYGGGSIKRNGVYDSVMNQLSQFEVYEFSGIEANPQYDTCMKAVELIRSEQITFLLAVGGGSVVDACKFIAAAAMTEGDPWQIVTSELRIQKALDFGVILTLPATGSETNYFSVISRQETQEKYGFGDPHLYAKFAILDPLTTLSLDQRQIGNGVVDAFVHVIEQYLTYPADAEVQDQWAEGLLRTLIQEGDRSFKEPQNSAARTNLMWSATLALNGLIGVGVPQDWSTHTIGHELTAFFGIDHARTLALILPAVMEVQFVEKKDKIKRYLKNVWNTEVSNDEELKEKCIQKTRAFFESLGLPTTFKAYPQVNPKDLEKILAKFSENKTKGIGERQTLTQDRIARIFEILSR